MNLKNLFALLTQSFPLGLTRITPISAERWTTSIDGRQVIRHAVGMDVRGIWLLWEFSDGEKLQIWWSDAKRARVERNGSQTSETATVGLRWTIFPLRATVVVGIRSGTIEEILRGRL